MISHESFDADRGLCARRAAIMGEKLWYHPKWFAKWVPDPDIEGRRLEEQPATSWQRIGMGR